MSKSETKSEKNEKMDGFLNGFEVLDSWSKDEESKHRGTELKEEKSKAMHRKPTEGEIEKFVETLKFVHTDSCNKPEESKVPSVEKVRSNNREDKSKVEDRTPSNKYNKKQHNYPHRDFSKKEQGIIKDLQRSSVENSSLSLNQPGKTFKDTKSNVSYSGGAIKKTIHINSSPLREHENSYSPRCRSPIKAVSSDSHISINEPMSYQSDRVVIISEQCENSFVNFDQDPAFESREDLSNMPERYVEAYKEDDLRTVLHNKKGKSEQNRMIHEDIRIEKRKHPRRDSDRSRSPNWLKTDDSYGRMSLERNRRYSRSRRSRSNSPEYRSHKRNRSRSPDEFPKERHRESFLDEIMTKLAAQEKPGPHNLSSPMNQVPYSGYSGFAPNSFYQQNPGYPYYNNLPPYPYIQGYMPQRNSWEYNIGYPGNQMGAGMAGQFQYQPEQAMFPSHRSYGVVDPSAQREVTWIEPPNQSHRNSNVSVPSEPIQEDDIIPPPPPPPVLTEFEEEDVRSVISSKRRKKLLARENEENLSKLIQDKNVSLSCLLEAAISSGIKKKPRILQFKKEIVSRCEAKITQLYRRRIAGVGCFMPDLTNQKDISYLSPLTMWTSSRINCKQFAETSCWKHNNSESSFDRHLSVDFRNIPHSFIFPQLPLVENTYEAIQSFENYSSRTKTNENLQYLVNQWTENEIPTIGHFQPVNNSTGKIHERSISSIYKNLHSKHYITANKSNRQPSNCNFPDAIIINAENTSVPSVSNTEQLGYANYRNIPVTALTNFDHSKGGNLDITFLPKDIVCYPDTVTKYPRINNIQLGKTMVIEDGESKKAVFIIKKLKNDFIQSQTKHSGICGLKSSVKKDRSIKSRYDVKDGLLYSRRKGNFLIIIPNEMESVIKNSFLELVKLKLSHKKLYRLFREHFSPFDSVVGKITTHLISAINRGENWMRILRGKKSPFIYFEESEEGKNSVLPAKAEINKVNPNSVSDLSKKEEGSHQEIPVPASVKQVAEHYGKEKVPQESSVSSQLEKDTKSRGKQEDKHQKDDVIYITTYKCKNTSDKNNVKGSISVLTESNERTTSGNKIPVTLNKPHISLISEISEEISNPRPVTKTSQKTQDSPKNQEYSCSTAGKPSTEKATISISNQKNQLGQFSKVLRETVLEAQLLDEYTKSVIKKISEGDKTANKDYILRAGVLCKKYTNPEGVEKLKMELPNSAVKNVIQNVHTISYPHATFERTLITFKKFFSPLENIENLICQCIQECHICNKT